MRGKKIKAQEGVKAPKVQLKIQIDPAIHERLRRLCDATRRTPAGQIEHMTLAFCKGGVENP